MFSDLLKAAMEEKGVKASELSAATGFARSTISYYLSGDVEPSDERKEQLALGLGYEASYFKDLFAEQLGKVMKQKKVNQTELANILGVTSSSISQYLSGRSKPTRANRERMAIILGLPLNYFNPAYAKMLAQTDNQRLNLPVSLAALLMGKTSAFVRAGLKQHVFPFGYAVKIERRYEYYISPVKFTEYTGCIIPTDEDTLKLAEKEDFKEREESVIEEQEADIDDEASFLGD